MEAFLSAAPRRRNRPNKEMSLWGEWSSQTRPLDRRRDTLVCLTVEDGVDAECRVMEERTERKRG